MCFAFPATFYTGLYKSLKLYMFEKAFGCIGENRGMRKGLSLHAGALSFVACCFWGKMEPWFASGGMTLAFMTLHFFRFLPSIHALDPWHG